MSTNLLPAAQLMALADTMANTHTASPDFFEARDAYKAARAASPVTLEEALCAEAADDDIVVTTDVLKSWMARVDSAGKAINARRLAGEGGGKC